MALSQSVLSELLDAFRAGEGVDLIRDAVQLVLQELIEVEATEQIGAARYERTDARTTERNGSRPRLLTTQAGDVELRIPKLRKGSFFPSILEPRRRIDQALYAVVMEAYVNGVSTRAVDDLVDALGVDVGDLKKSEVSRICAGLDEIVGAFRTRRLDHIEFPYVYLDATYLHVRNAAGQVTSMAVVVATGITADGDREVLGVDVGDSEDEVFWRGFLRSLQAARPGRGAAGHLRPARRPGRRPAPRASKAPAINAAASTSPATCWPSCPSRIRTWSPRCSAPSSPSPTPTPSPPPGTRSATSSPTGSPRSAALMDDAKSRGPRLHRLPPSALDARSGRPTRSSGSTKKSNAAPASWASSPTKPPSSASSAPSSPTSTTNGKPATAATSPKAPWPCSTPTAILTPSPTHPGDCNTEDHLEAHHSVGLLRRRDLLAAAVAIVFTAGGILIAAVMWAAWTYENGELISGA